jgi:carbon-monoxide dehydrogenase medium subunit
MRYEEPETLAEAVSLLTATPDARCLAGGAVVVGLMNANIIEPPLLVGLRRVPALFGIAETATGVRIGPMTNHTTLAADARLSGAMAVVRSAASQIAHPSIRNMATIGGSICSADPDADLPGALVAAAAEVEVVGPGGSRALAIEDVFVGRFQTALARDEILAGISLPRGVAGAVGHHLKFSRVEGDYATVSISLVLAVDGDTCSYARVAVGSCGPVPVHEDAADQRLIGSALGSADVAEAAQILVDASSPVDDVRGSAEYRRLLIPRLLGLAVSRAREQAHV